MKRIVRTSISVLGLVGALAVTGLANAAPLGVTNAGVTIWNFINPGSDISDPCVQALASNPCATAGNQVYSGQYTGSINFTNPATNDIVSFLNTAGGTFVGGVGGLTQTLSTGGFKTSTLIEMVFTITNEIVGTISHDDGISIYDSANVLLIDSSFPTVVADTNFDLMPGTYSLWYTEVNGLPAELVMDMTKTVRRVPEPATLAMLGLGLAGLGFSRRRKSN